MGHTKNRQHTPRHGTKQYWPKKRAKRMYARVRSWVNSKNTLLQAFPGYKVGMTHVVLKDNRTHSITKGENIVWPVTVVECPAIRIFSIRFYKNTPYGLRLVSEILNNKLDKDVERKVVMPKKDELEVKLKEMTSNLDKSHELRVNVYTQPKKVGIEKKKPEIMEIGICGSDIKTKFEYVKGLLDKEIKVSDIIKQGNKFDVHSVTKGKGFQGTVKRFGVQLRSHKSEKKRRGNVIGAEMPKKVLWGTMMPGGLGTHLRTEYNRDILFVGQDPNKVNPKGGFLHYGLIKNDYLLIKGSVAGHVKRLVTLVEPVRGGKGLGAGVEIVTISQESKQ